MDNETSTQSGAPHLETIAELAELEQRAKQSVGFSERLAHRISFFSGSMLFVWVHVVWFGLWVLFNIALSRSLRFDPPPFGVLTLVVSLEAIFLSTFVLISQNRQSLEADKRAKLDLQLNMIAEREITKVMNMIAELQQHVGMKVTGDIELDAMQKTTRLQEIAKATEEAEHTALSPGETPEKPVSAAAAGS